MIPVRVVPLPLTSPPSLCLSLSLALSLWKVGERLCREKGGGEGMQASRDEFLAVRTKMES